jgi:2-(1,2-epoxy-1,2-dihydrophenyl)acetyl-CoA isomerase
MLVGRESMSDEILLEHPEEGIARLVLNRPQKLNAINQAMRAEIEHALDDIDASTTRVLILAAAPGRAFSVGGDIDERKRMGPDEIRQMRHRLSNPYLRLYQRGMPVIAAISGLLSRRRAGAGARADLESPMRRPSSVCPKLPLA